MTFKDKVQELISKALDTRSDLFLIDFSISPDNKITVIIDGDKGVTLQDCIDVSRVVEHNLDREEQDFSLEVASAGVAVPLKLLRQYHKNIGRKLNVVTTEKQKIEATLEEVRDGEIVLRWKARELKPIGKGKITVEKEAVIAFDKIKEANVIISF